MLKFTMPSKKKPGAAPGTLVHTGAPKSGPVRITLTDYDREQVREQPDSGIDDVISFKELPSVSWINVDGVYDVDLIARIGQEFAIHPLTLEDIVNTAQRPKAEDFDTYAYFVLKMLHYREQEEEICAEQVSLVLTPTMLISFQEGEGDVFAPVRERIRKGRGQIRKRGCDYLTYALIDAVVDHYFVIFEKVGEQMEALEEQLLEHPTHDTLLAIHDLKREMIFMRRQIWPLREMINTITRGEFALVAEDTGIFFKDVYDHTIQIIDTIESYRDLLSGMLDLYLSTISNRMNEVMKVLTIIATIFIPITFIAGVYGMNFKYMPELEWPGAYFAVWGLMLVVAIVMVLFFRRRQWL